MKKIIKLTFLTMTLAFYDAIAMAQTQPGGTTAPTETGAVGDTGGTMSWLWFVIAVIVVFGLLYYLFGRNRSTRI